MKAGLKAFDIQWDIDDGDDVILPNEIYIPEGITEDDDISDYLSDATGYCHNGYWVKYDPIDFAENYLGIKLKWYQKIYLWFIGKVCWNP